MLTTPLFDKLGIKASRFGFGTMRLPMLKEDTTKVDKNEAIKMIRYAIDNGVNYIDTAYPYHGGESELIVGEALQDGYRDKVILVTKLPTFSLKDKSDMEKFLDEQLKKLQTDHIDFYLLHTLSKRLWATCKEFDALKFLDESIASGKIRFSAFSFHDEYPLFEEIINAYKWDMCQIQLNYLDIDYQAGVKGMKLAGLNGIPVVAMEPLKGGQLAKDIPEIRELWKSSGLEYNAVAASFRWVVSHPEIATTLSGVSTMEQTEENIKLFSKIDCAPLTPLEESLYIKAREILLSKTKIGCTACNYCMPCPHGVNIPGVFERYNNSAIFDDVPTYARHYKWFHTDNGSDASKCIACNKCELACPQNLPIIKTLKEAHELLKS